MELWQLTVHELSQLLLRKEVSATELLESVWGRIEEVEDQVKSYITLDPEGARAAAAESQRLLESGRPRSALEGIPCGLKDVLSTKGLRTTCGSKILSNYVPPYDATAVQALKEAGTVILGKTNMDEFAMGSSCENSGFFPTHNPWDLTRVPGGSSGGSASAVAAGEAMFTLGSDTGGSVRQPASLCGVVGMKPTYGAVSRYGLIAFASSLDQIGPLTRDVTDCAMVLDFIVKHDPMDSTSVEIKRGSYLEALRPADEAVKGLKIGVPKEYMGKGLEPGVEAQVKKALELLQELGAEVEECSLPHSSYALDAYYVIAPAEASSNLARYDGVRYGYRSKQYDDLIDMYRKTRAEGFGPEVKRRIMLGTYALSAGYYDAYYLKAQKVRTLIREDFDKVFAKFDVIAGPTSPTVAFKLGEKVDDPLAMYLSDIFTIPVNLAGLPGISVPCGFSEGLPVGLQFIGKAFDESTLLRVAYATEQACSLGNMAVLCARALAKGTKEGARG
ncbi:MAG TPA: Asp-tRNA(Asn)/Glu-tRNA(Gln) amidotransferase subunit GatA [Firmicutes bacterium]|nr:Asp-tRNA(Asn)/Glu-tRNA(Gln) amidotransferase subunit GatA [Bacillota bacterium]